MKKIILVFAAMICSLLNGRVFAQDVQTAVLQHGDELKVFYGSYALRDALSNAQHGDDITLSAGTFSVSEIKKSVSIHGSGFVNDPENNRFRTVLDGTIFINLPEEYPGFLLEGIYNGGNIYLENNIGATINACFISNLHFGMEGSSSPFLTENCIISNSRISRIEFNNNTHKNLCLYNDIIGYLLPNNYNSNLHVDHCVIAISGSYLFKPNTGITGGGYDSHEGKIYGRFTNSIINYPTRNTVCSAYNNIIGGQNFNTADQHGNVLLSISEINDLFISSKMGDDANILVMDYKLKDNPLMGTDGTPVGIYGGEAPFNDIPGIPQIVSKEISSQSDAEGKLSVKIKVQTN